MADAVSTESISQLKAIDPPRASILERKFLTEYAAPALIGVVLAMTVLGAREHFISKDPTPNIQQSTRITEVAPIARPSLEPVIKIPEQPGKIEKIKAEYFGDPVQMAKDVLVEERLVRNIVNDVRLNIPQQDKDFWVKRMLGIIAIESESGVHASSGVAFGLVQLKQETANELAGEYKMPTPNLFNPVENIFFGIAYQIKWADRYGKDLALWTHHLGSGNMDEVLLAYLKPLLPEGDSLTEKGISSNAQLKRYIEHYGVTTEVLINDLFSKNSIVKKRLIELKAYNDKTDQYWLKYRDVMDAIAQVQGTRG